MPFVHAILDAVQLDTGSVTLLIATKMGGCKLVLSFRYNLYSFPNAYTRTYLVFVCV